jgi:hypothetical protein
MPEAPDGEILEETDDWPVECVLVPAGTDRDEAEETAEIVES